MQSSVFVYDPTVHDEQSKVRGVGRYLEILRENFQDEWKFTNNLSLISKHAPSVFINPFFNFLQKPVAMRRVAKKQIAVVHDLIPLKYPDSFPIGIKGKINVFLSNLALKNYDTIVTDSQASKRDIIRILKLSENVIKVIYPCLPKVFLKSKSETPNSKLGINSNSKNLKIASGFCLYVGDATWNKNLVNLAKAIKIANVTCVFVGKVFTDADKLSNPWQNELKEFLSETRNDKRFILAGFLPDKELINLYKQTKLNILLSRDEGFGFSFLEAASQGTPSVLSDIEVFRELASDSASFSSFEDCYEAANKIGEIYFNKGMQKNLGLKALQRSKYFDTTRFKSEFLKTIG